MLEEGVEKLVGCQAKKKVECEPVDRPQKKPVNRRILKTGFRFFLIVPVTFESQTTTES